MRRNQAYLLAVKAYLTKYYPTEVLSIILFGSLLDNQETLENSTDIDLLIILSDTCTIPTFNKIHHELLGIEAQYMHKKESFFNLFWKGLQNATGMFVNLFICRYSDFKDENFALVFGVNRFIASLLAPKSSVWLSLKQRHFIIWGEDVFAISTQDTKLQVSDIFRSLALNTLLSIGAIGMGFISRNTSQFSMEAVKWSLFTWRNFLNDPSTSLSILCKRYTRNGSNFEKRLLTQFLMFRKTQELNRFLILLAPIFIFGLHRKLIRKLKGI